MKQQSRNRFAGKDTQHRRHAQSGTSSSLNVPWLIGSLALFVALALAAYGWWSYQVEGQLAQTLPHVRALAASGRLVQAIEVCRRYTRQRPGDPEGLHLLASLADQAGQVERRVAPAARPRVIRYYQRALALDGSQEVARRRLVELLLQSRRSREALEHVERMLALDADEPELLKLKAAALHAMAERDVQHASAAREALALAWQHNRDDIGLALEYAEQLWPASSNSASRAASSAPTSIDVLDQLVVQRPNEVDPLIARYQFLLRHHQHPGDTDLIAALNIDGRHPVVLELAATHAERAGNLSEARNHFRELSAADPKNPSGYLGQVRLLRREHHFLEAQRVFDQVRASLGEPHPEVELEAAETLLASGRSAQAITLLSALPDSMALGGRSQPKLSQRRRSILSRHRALLLAQALREQGQPVRAREAAQLGLEQPEPEPRETADWNARLWEAIAESWQDERSFLHAGEAYQAALKFQPQSSRLQILQGRALLFAGQREAAFSHLELAAQSNSAPLVAWLILLRDELQRQVAAPWTNRNWSDFERFARQAGKSHPGSPALEFLELQALLARGDVSTALARLATLAEGSTERLVPTNSSPRDLPTPVSSAGIEVQEPASSKRPEEFVDAAAISIAHHLFGDARENARALLQLFERWRRVGQRDLVSCCARLGDSLESNGPLADAQKQVQTWLAAEPGSLSPAVLLADVALRTTDFVALDQALAAILRIEPQGLYGPWFEAQRLLAARPLAPDVLAEVQALAGQLHERHPGTFADRLLPAFICEAGGETEAAIDAYRDAWQQGVDSQLFLGRLARLLFASRRDAEADAVLVSLLPEPTAPLNRAALHAQYLLAANRREEAIDRIRRYLAEPGAPLATQQALGLLSTFQHHPPSADQASTLMALAKLMAQRDSVDFSAVCDWLRARGRRALALELCLDHAAAEPTPRIIDALCRVLLPEVDASDAARAEHCLALAAEQRQLPAQSLLLLANVRSVQGSDDSAWSLYQRVLSVEPDNIAALNNAALLLSLQPSRQHLALELIERACSSVENMPSLHDTRGVVLWRMGRLQPALEILEGLANANGSPVFWLHLAQVQASLGKRLQAQESLDRARQAGLDSSSLLAAERREFAALSSTLSGSATAIP